MPIWLEILLFALYAADGIDLCLQLCGNTFLLFIFGLQPFKLVRNIFEYLFRVCLFVFKTLNAETGALITFLILINLFSQS